MPNNATPSIVIPLPGGRTATLFPADKGFPEKVQLVLEGGGAPTFVESSWKIVSFTSRRMLASAAGLSDAAVSLIAERHLAWVAELETQKAQQKALHDATEARKTKAYELRIRRLDQPAATANVFVTERLDEVVQILQKTGYEPETLLEWPKDDLDRLAILDLDFHKQGVDHPTDAEIDDLGYNLSPAPWCWWRTQGGGLHALYAQAPLSIFTANELGAGAMAQVLTHPVVVRCAGTAELIPRTRHPGAAQKGASCGPVHATIPDETFACLARFASAGATLEEAQEVMEENGLVIGARVAHSYCIIDPDHVSTSATPVMVMEAGLYCHSCAGRLGDGFRSWGAVRKYQGLEVTATRVAEPIKEAVENFVTFTHAEYVLGVEAPEIPKQCREPLYRALLKQRHGDKPRVGACFEDFHFVRGMGSWLYKDTLRMVSNRLTPADVGVLPSTFYVDEEGVRHPIQALISVHTNGGNVPGWTPLQPSLFVPIFRVHNSLESKAGEIICEPKVRCGDRPVVTYVPPKSRLSAAEAERRIDGYFPGVSMTYIKALIIAMGCAESQRGMIPMLWATGPSGSAKSQTVKIVAEMFGETYIDMMPVKEDRFDETFGQALETTRIISFNDFVKMSKEHQQIHTFFLRLDRSGHTYHKLNVGRVTPPVDSMMVMTDMRKPSAFTQDRQFGRRVHLITLNPVQVNWDTRDIVIERWWTRTKELSEAACSLYSHIVDDFFPADDTENFNKKMKRIGIHRVADEVRGEQAEEKAAILEVLRELVYAVCNAKDSTAVSQRRLGRGCREIHWGTGNPIGAACSVLIDMQGDQEYNGENLGRVLDGYNAELQSMFGLVCPAAFVLKAHGKQLFITLIETGSEDEVEHKNKRINRELFPTWPPQSPDGAPVPLTNPEGTLVSDDGTTVVMPTGSPAGIVASMAALSAPPPEPPQMVFNPDPNYTVPQSKNGTTETIYIDYETQSECDLKKCGSYVYAEHPTTKVICAAIRATGYKIFWTMEYYPGLVMPKGVYYQWGLDFLRSMITADVTVSAHNTSFERPITTITLGLPDPAEWIDTANITKARGLPAGADQAGLYLFGMGKDIEGYKLMMKTCKPDRKGVMPPITQVVVQRYVAYNFRDTDIGVGVADRFGIDTFPEWEADVMFAHHEINHRGVAIDRKFCETLRSFDEGFKSLAATAVEETTRRYCPNDVVTRADLTRNKFLMEWFKKQLPKGVAIDNLRQTTLEALIDVSAENQIELPPQVLSVIENRLVVTRAALAKVDTALRWVNRDGRIRATLNAYAAHTGRWGGFGPQFQNMKRPDEDSFDLKAAIEAVEAGDLDRFKALCRHKKTGELLPPYQLLGSLVRGIIVPAPGHVLLPTDYTGVEARGLLWMAEDWENLNEHIECDRDPKAPDVYCRAAAAIYGRTITKKENPTERQVGKISTLACLAEGTPVLTESGWKAIETVTTDDRVWDGCEWVEHEGLVERGVKACIEVDGLWMTPDHEVLTDTGWESAECLHQRPRYQENSSADGRCWLTDHRNDGFAGVAAAPKTSSTPAISAEGCLRAATFVQSSAPQRQEWGSAASLRWFLMTFIAVVFSTATTRWSVGARIRAWLVTLGTAAAEFEFTLHGWLIRNHFFSMLSASPGGTMHDWSWTAKTTMGTTSQETYVLPPGNSKRRTVGALGGYYSMENGISSANFAPSSARRFATTIQCSENSEKALLPSRSSPIRSSAKVRTKNVYDLANAGPNNRFQAGRLIVHNCGYQGSVGAVNRFAYAYGIDLAEVGIDPKEIVNGWRGKNIRSVNMWHDVERAFKRAMDLRGKTIEAARCGFTAFSDRVEVRLPSGRNLTYMNARLAPSTRTGWEDNLVITYDTAVHGKAIAHETYGGSLVENLVQSVCRDFLAQALVAIEAEGYPIVLHVHDEAVPEVPENKADEAVKVIRQIMSTAPDWAHGMPLVGVPQTVKRYGK